MAEIPKVVFSTTLEPPLTWANIEFVAEDAVTALRTMKEEARAPMRTMGSISLNKALLREGPRRLFVPRGHRRVAYEPDLYRLAGQRP